MTAALAAHLAVAVGLRPWREEDADELAAMYRAARPELVIEEPWRGLEFLTAEGQRERVRRCCEDSRAAGFVISEGGAIAGHLSLDRIGAGVVASAELGYWVAPSQRGRGIATRAIGLAVEHAMGRLGLTRLHATVASANRPSWRALERNGFQRVGVVPVFWATLGSDAEQLLYQLGSLPTASG